MHLKTELNSIYREDSGALINKNNGALNEYRRKRQELNKFLEMQKQIEYLQKEVQFLKEIIEKMSIKLKV
jgi:dynactin complex subunit